MPYRAFNKRKRFSVLGRRVRPRSVGKNAFLARRAKLLRYGRYAGRFSRAALAFEAGSMLYRGWKGRARREIGERPGSSSAKREVVFEQNITNRDTRQLYNERLTDIIQGTGINERERRIVNIRGWKICMEIKNLRDIPLYVNVAVIAPKMGTTTSGVGVGDFFRASQGADRARDFDTSLSGLEFHCLPINTDRYTILKHKRTRLVAMAAGGDTVALSGYSYMNIDWWIPLKRQVRYDGSTGDKNESGRVYLVYWFDGFSANAATLSVANAAQASIRAVAYFRDPGN